MKLWSSPSVKGPVKRLKPVADICGVYISFRDAVIIAVVAVLWFAIGLWWFTWTAPVKVQAIEPVQVEIEESVEVMLVETDESLILAVGIDAVVSSIPGGELASNMTLEMVATTIMNRVEDARYPGTIEGVLTQPKQFSCFDTTGVKWVGKAKGDEEFKGRCMAAATKILNGERNLPHDVVYVSGVEQGTTVAMLDGLYFGR